MLNKRLVITFLIILFMINGPVLAGDTFDPPQGQIEGRTLDRRAQILQSYLTKFNSPLTYQAQNFVDAADAYNLDFRLVAAIAGVESTFGKFIPGGYNAWGWGVYGNQAVYFKSWEEGIFTVSKGLRENYLNKGLNDPYAINRAYAASPVWGSKVSYFLQDMEKFQNQVNSLGLKAVGTPGVAGSSALLVQKLP